MKRKIYSLLFAVLLIIVSNKIYSLTPLSAPVINVDSVIKVTCFGNSDGAVYISVSGGVAPYIYSWSQSNSTTQNLIHVAAGTYAVLVTDANSDTASQVIVVQQPAILMIAQPIITATCSNTNTGVASVTPTGGTPPYTYSWSPSGQTTSNATGLSPGTYSCFVTDANGCTAVANLAITINPLPVVTVSPPTQICLGASATLAASGGVAYSWSNGQTGNIMVTPPVGITTYTVTVTGVNGCVNSNTTSVTVIQPTITISPPANTLCAGDSVSFCASGGYSYSWMPSSSLTNPISSCPTTHPTATTTYSIYVTDVNGCTNTSSTTITVVANCNRVKGYSFVDMNSNGIKDSGDLVMNSFLINSIGNTYSSASLPDAQGFFSNAADTGTIITSPQNNPAYTYYTFSPLQHVSNFPAYNLTDSVNFIYTPIPGIQDLNISVIPFHCPRPGDTTIFQINYSNVGTDTVSGSVYFVKASKMTFVSSNPSYTSMNGDTIEWQYINMPFLTSDYIDVRLSTPTIPTVNLGDTLNFSAIIEPVATDTTPADNYFSITQTVGGSFDPNEKSMLGGDHITTGQLANGEYFTYLIRFQNTGNDTAFKVVVRDTLDSKLDGSTFEMISVSNEYSLSIENQKNIAWTFNNILLPDSNANEAASHGFVCYKVKAKNGISAGDVISNTGHIFFDYNPDIVTNTTQTAIVTGIENIPNAVSGLQLYPNPSKDEFTIYGLTPGPSPKESGATLIEVYDILGEKLISTSFVGNQITISCKQLSPGIYFVRINGDAGILRLVKID